MSDSVSSNLDIATLVADDRLLDVLAAGRSPDVDEPVTALLAAWRVDLDDDLDSAIVDRYDGIRDGGVDPLAALADPVGPPADPAGPGIARVVPLRGRRWPLRLAAAAAVVVVAGVGAVTTAASHAGPHSPLWSLTKVLYDQQAHEVAAEDDISRARQAVAADRYDDASRLLDRALVEIGQIRDPDVAGRLRAEVGAVRAMIPPTTAPAAGPSAVPSPGPTPTPASPPAGSPPAPAPTPGAPSSSPVPGLLPGLPLPPLTGSGGLLPSLPSLPLPGLSLF